MSPQTGVVLLGMAAVQAYPAADIAAEGALFWSTLQAIHGTAQRYALDWGLTAAQTLVRPFATTVIQSCCACMH